VNLLKKLLARLVRQSPAMIVAMLALFVALTGTAVATTSALITGAQIKNSSITGADVKNRSLRPIDFRGSVRGPRGPAGPAGATGATGATGAKGDKGDKGDAGAAATKLFAAVQADGTLIATRSSGVNSVTKDAGAGTYRVYFDQSVAACAAVVTPSNPGDAPETLQGASQDSPISGGGLTNNGFFVQLANNAGTLTDVGFHLAVFC
jgi:hypothetical protein